MLRIVAILVLALSIPHSTVGTNPYAQNIACVNDRVSG